MTKEEKMLWYNFLKCLSFKFIRQRAIDNYIVDFYCSKLKLVIEVDGSHHYTEDRMGYDNIRTEILNAYGLSAIRVSNKDINGDFQKVCVYIEDMIRECLNGSLDEGAGESALSGETEGA